MDSLHTAAFDVPSRERIFGGQGYHSRIGAGTADALHRIRGTRLVQIGDLQRQEQNRVIDFI